MKLQWIGGPTFLLHMGSFKILGDPVFGTGETAFHLVSPRQDAAVGNTAEDRASVPVARLEELPEADLDAVDLVMASSTWADHFDAAAVERLDKNLTVILPAGQGKALEADGFRGTRTLEWWKEAFETRGDETLTILATPVGVPEPRAEARAPGGNGYIIRHAVGNKSYTVYWTGDTVWFSDAREIKTRAGDVDLMIVHLGAVGADTGRVTTLNGKEAMQFVFMFQPRRVVPTNHNTFSHYTESVEDFKQRIDLTMYDRRLALLKEGETFEHNRG